MQFPQRNSVCLCLELTDLFPDPLREVKLFENVEWPAASGWKPRMHSHSCLALDLLPLRQCVETGLFGGKLPLRDEFHPIGLVLQVG